jgi:hypothetical protein
MPSPPGYYAGCSPDVVRLPDHALFEDLNDRLAVVLHKQPMANLQPTINRKRFAGQGMRHNQRNQLVGETQ